MRSIVILAAGTGSRMNLGYNKVLHILKNNKSILQMTIETFIEAKLFNEIILVIKKGDEKKINEQVKNYKGIKVVYGKDKRQHSVYEGVLMCTNDIVYIHDGARCNLSQSSIMKLEEKILEKETFDLVTLGVKSKDTISLVKNNKIISNLERDDLQNIQTPQVLKQKKYLAIFDKNTDYTDESSLYFANGCDVIVVEGDYGNIKITTKEDLEYYEYIKFIRK